MWYIFTQVYKRGKKRTSCNFSKHASLSKKGLLERKGGFNNRGEL